MSPVQVRGEVLSRRRVGAYHLLEVVAPGVAEAWRPGQFVAVTVGGPTSSLLLRRAFAIYRATPAGAYAGTVQFVVAVHGRGTEWLAGVRPGDPLDVVGPLGRPFLLPTRPVPAVLVGGGYGSAPLIGLAEALHARDCRVDYVLGASTADRIFGEMEAKRGAGTIVVTTDDGSAGTQGRVSNVLPEVIDRSGALAVYACGPMPMLRAVAAVAASYGVPCQVAVEESMACGIGVCMTCVLPIVGADGVTRMTRSCVDGPVFMADRVRFDDVGSVPPDTLGAPPPAVAADRPAAAAQPRTQPPPRAAPPPAVGPAVSAGEPAAAMQPTDATGERSAATQPPVTAEPPGLGSVTAVPPSVASGMAVRPPPAPPPPVVAVVGAAATVDADRKPAGPAPRAGDGH